MALWSRHEPNFPEPPKQRFASQVNGFDAVRCPAYELVAIGINAKGHSMGIKYLVCAASAALLMVSATSPASAATITGLWNTAVDGSNNLLVDGSVDTHYVLNGSDAPIVYNHPAYLTAGDARFIGAEANGGYTSNPNTYTLTFDLAGLNPLTAALSGFFAADNYGSVYLNNNLLAAQPAQTIYENFQKLTSFSATAAQFVSGSNVLKFVVTDTGPPSALIVSGLSGMAMAVPEPASWALMIVGFGLAGAALRRRRAAVAA